MSAKTPALLSGRPQTRHQLAASLGTMPAHPPCRAYRPDIDGLRAVAVAAIILTHAGIPGFRGGFVGVDMFFVISGYLIYRDILGRLLEGGPCVLAFYGRRFRRILPGLYVVTAVTLVGATWVMLPGELDETARAALGAVLLVPNIVSLSQTGYFDHAALAKPLLHAWSLGVEAQFYLVAPFLPFALRRAEGRTRLLILCGLFGLALAGCIAVRLVSKDAAFFLMPSRVFEFLIGCLLAERALPILEARRLAEAVAALAVLAILVAVTMFSAATPLPGLLSLVPCLATAAIIHAGASHRTLVSRVLGRRSPAFVGRISYSVYLWHWPIMVFARYEAIPLVIAVPLTVGLLAVASVLSWRFIEVPFRTPGTVARRLAPILFPGGAIALVGCCLVLIAENGLPGRFPPDIASVASFYSYASLKPYREGECFITSKESAGDFDWNGCLATVKGRRNVLIVGDSHAAHLWSGIHDSWPAVRLLQATASGCKPVLDPVGADRCTSLMGRVFDEFLPAHRVDAIIIAALWADDDIPRLVRTIEALKPHAGAVIVFGPMPRYDEPVSTLLARSMLHDNLHDVAAHQLAGVAPLDRKMRAAIAPIATYISPYDAICPKGRCRLFAAAGVPMQFDYHHLTREGADWLIKTVRAEGDRLF